MCEDDVEERNRWRQVQNAKQQQRGDDEKLSQFQNYRYPGFKRKMGQDDKTPGTAKSRHSTLSVHY